MAIPPSIVNLAPICARKGVTHFVLSPGSRCAPLTITLARHPDIRTRVVPDERAAAFIALGMAQQLGGPVGLVCTSGTAVLNYAPAVAEAFYQQVPLLVLTADRPPEWIEQQDGQTLNQREVYGKHVKASYQLPTDYVHADAEWQAERILNEAINLAGQYPKGPVHINVPLREPLYPAPGEKITFGPVRIIEQWPAGAVLSPGQWVALREMWEESDRKLVVAGQHAHAEELVAVLRQIGAEMQIPVVGDVISNLHPLPDACRYADTVLMRQDEAWRESLRPDLLITFGNSVISKNLKLFLRKHKPAFHWHLQPAGPVADAFQTLTHVLRVEPLYFFRTLFADLDYQHFLQDDEEDADQDYYNAWRQGDQDAARRLGKLFREAPFGEFEAVAECLDALPDDSVLHLANSMAVRYANFAGLGSHQRVEVFANRGTSGIDGCTSTAVGAALQTDRIVTLITGDVAFFYDRNGLWHNFLPPNLRIVLLNNHGGGIFRLIDGPAGQPELEEYFETRQPLRADRAAGEFGLTYFPCRTRDELRKHLPAFFASDGGAKLLEVETDAHTNADIYRQFKQGNSGQ